MLSLYAGEDPQGSLGIIPLSIYQKVTQMLAFFRENLGLILGIVIFGALILGGIYYVEHSLESQEQVVQ
ncbi:MULTISPECIES: hypothetical protein [Shewanella]|uniref:hypothetical protein n=1 Tax=Shewanella TaxID=22 RepID=UPI0018E7B3E3|nr:MULTISPECIES: hypothetical protein [Shewanella]